MGAVAVWTVRLWELVLDGPVPFTVAQSEMARLVPPGRAFRDHERYLEWGRRKDGRTVQSKELSEDEKDARIRMGQMKMAYTAIWAQIRSGRVEQFEQDGIKMLRVGPNVPKVIHPTSIPRVIQTHSVKGSRQHPAPSVTKMAPHTIRIWQRLFEADEVSFDSIVADAARLVPPQTAYRRAATKAEANRQKRNGKARNFLDPEKAKDKTIRAGQRGVVTSAISSFVSGGRIERFTLDGQQFLRRGPNFWIGEPPRNVSHGD
jgi:hypothetical protein